MIRPLSATRDEAEGLIGAERVDQLARRGLAVVDAAFLNAVSRINLDTCVLVRRGWVARDVWAAVDRDSYGQRDVGPEALFRGTLEACIAYASGPQELARAAMAAGR